jgi:hypothetical protein
MDFTLDCFTIYENSYTRSPKNMKTKLYKTIAFTSAFVCMGTKLSLLGEEKAWIVFENEVLGSNP